MTSLVRPETFIQICLSVVKLFYIFCTTDRETHKSSVTLFHQNIAIFTHFKWNKLVVSHTALENLHLQHLHTILV